MILKMANCDDANKLPTSPIENINEHELTFASEVKFQNVNAEYMFEDLMRYSNENVNSGHMFDVDGKQKAITSSFDMIKKNLEGAENNKESPFCNTELDMRSELTEDLSFCENSIYSPASLSPDDKFIDQEETDICCISATTVLSTESNLQTIRENVSNPKKSDSINVIGDPNYIEKSRHEPIGKEVMSNMNRVDCRAIFSSKDNYNVIKNTSVSEDLNTSLVINNNVAQTVNKAKELTESEEHSSDTMLPLFKSCHAIASKKKRMPNLACRGRRVSFPEDDTSLITSYLEPVNPCEKMSNVNREDIIKAYQASCERHGTVALPTVLQQISALPLDTGGRVQCLNFRYQKLDYNHCECLEEVFRRVQFKMLNFESCDLDDDSVIALFDMIEFYDSATQLNISCNPGISSRGWQICAKMLKKSQSIELLDARCTNMCEQTVPILARLLRLDTKLQTLHLENCNLTERPLATLSAALRVNDTLKELYMADNHLGPKDCIYLENVFATNSILKTLDLRNNNIQDDGCKSLCQGIQTQQGNLEKNADSNKRTTGLINLVLWNNHITFVSVSDIAMMISTNSLQTLNIGKNNLTSEFMMAIQSVMLKNKSITDFGLQATKMDDEGVIALAECLAGNAVLKRIDLRGNNINIAGLSALASVVNNVNKTVVKIDIDVHTTLIGEEKALYSSMKSAITESCRKNHTYSHLNTDFCESHVSDLQCFKNGSPTYENPTEHVEVKRYFSPEPSPCPSPTQISSPVSSRFRVYKTPENVLSVAPTPAHVLSTSAPASLSIPAELNRCASLPSSTRVKDHLSRYRFTVTKVSENFNFIGSVPSKTVSAPSLNMSENYYQPQTVIVVPSSKPKNVGTFMFRNDSKTPDEIFLDVSTVQDSTISESLCDSIKTSEVSKELTKAPLAAMEGESFDTDSEETESISDKCSFSNKDMPL